MPMSMMTAINLVIKLRMAINYNELSEFAKNRIFGRLNADSVNLSLCQKQSLCPSSDHLGVSRILHRFGVLNLSRTTPKLRTSNTSASKFSITKKNFNKFNLLQIKPLCPKALNLIQPTTVNPNKNSRKIYKKF
ncbi:hypothetical protein ACKWTF_015738 [Chironomus riparius]